MGDYSKLHPKTAQRILNQYGIEDEFTLKALSLGISNSNYKVDTGNKQYLLKVSNDKGFPELCDEQHILKHLKDLGFPYSICALPTIQGELVYQEEDLFGVLFPFIKGIPPGPSDITCREIGRALGKLHSTTKDVNLNVREYAAIGQDAKTIREFIDDPSCPVDFSEAFHQVFSDDLNGYLSVNKTRCLIHGDLYYDNTLFWDESIAVLLDFEQAGLGNALLDLGISISGSCVEKGQINPQLVESFCEGYKLSHALNENEKKYLADAILLGLFSIALWRIKRFKHGNLNPMLENSYRDLLNKAKSFKTIIDSKGLKFEL